MSEDYNSEVTNDEQIDVVDQSESQDDFALIPEEESEGTDDGQAEVVDQPQSREDNHIARQARLKAERELSEKAQRMATEEADRRIRESGAVNPYTDRPFESLKEFEDYGRKVKEAEQRERAENEGKTLDEVVQEDADREYIRKKKAEESEAAERAEKKREREQFFREDLENFQERYPDVDVEKLDSNKKFRKFVGSRYGREPLAELYEDYIDLVSEAEKNGIAKATTRSNRSTGTGESGGQTLTAQQKKDLDTWNRNNPDMKMTAKEFMTR